MLFFFFSIRYVETQLMKDFSWVKSGNTIKHDQ